MRMPNRWHWLILAIFFVTGSAFAQMAISAKSGMVHVADGEVYLGDTLIEPKANEFPDVKEGQVLRTAEGRAEVLLAPGTFLRMGEETAFKMLNNRLSDTRILLEKGVTLIEVVELLEGNALTIAVGDVTVSVQKAGLYRIESDPLRVRVYDGEVRVAGNGNAALVKAGRELLPASGDWATTKFDASATDSLFRWSRQRSSYLAMANVAAARQAGTGAGNSFTGRWFFNPWLGMMTWIPSLDTVRSPFGWSFFTPWTVQRFYTPPVFGGWQGGGAPGFQERSFGGSYSGGFAGSGLPSRSVGGAYSGGGMPSGGGSYAGGGASPGAPAGSAGGGAPARGGESAGGRGGAGGGGRQ